MRNLALERRRSRAPRPQPLDPESDVLFLADPADAGDETAAIEEAGRIREAIIGLDPDEREVVVLKVYCGLTLRGVARLLGRPLGTVASLHRRALLRIRSSLERETVHE
jgi:RNA polymerase sigma factor (sigma-70 family)